MATLVSPPLRAVANAAVDECGYASAVLSGMVPDPRHLDQGGYHCSVEDLRRYGNGTDYSNSRADDKNFNIKYGAAIDVTMSTADMKKNYKRVHAVWADKSDPRRKYLNCVNTWSGAGDAVRLDFVTGGAKYASPDHKWHMHLEIRRRHLLDDKAGRAVISMLRGESKASWIAREEPVAKPPTKPDTPVKTAPPAKAPPAKPAAPKPVAVRKPGSRQLAYTPGKPVLRGEDVAYVQRYIGPARAGQADGVFGAKTKAAASWYQRMRGLKPDGVVGPATWRAMGVKPTF